MNVDNFIKTKFGDIFELFNNDDFIEFYRESINHKPILYKTSENKYLETIINNYSKHLRKLDRITKLKRILK